MAFLENIQLTGITSVNNSTTTPLGAGATFTGTGEQNDLPDVAFDVTTDQDGTIFAEFSQDGTNWDTSLTFFYEVGKINPPHVFVKMSRHFRIRFENTSASAQTFLRISTYYGSFQKLTAPVNGTLSKNYDALVTRPTDYFTEVAEDKRQGTKDAFKFGYNEDIDTGSPEVVAFFGGTFTPLTAAETMDVVSTSANDTAAGTGAQTITIFGVDNNGLEIQETIAMNGLTTVTTTNSFLCINRAIVATAGSTQYNEGDINITATTAGTNQAAIPATVSVTQQLIYYVPSDKDSYIEAYVFDGAKTGGGSLPKVTLKFYNLVSGVRIELLELIVDVSIDSRKAQRLTVPQKIPGGSFWYVEAETSINNTFLRGRVDQVIIDKKQ